MNIRTHLSTIAVLALVTAGANLANAQSPTPVDANPATPPAQTASVQPDQQPVAPAPVPTLATPPPIAPQPAEDVNQAARDPRTLNEKLIPTDFEIREAIDGGRLVGRSKKDFLDVLNPARRSFTYHSGGMLGERRRSTGVAVWVTPGLEAYWRGYIEERSFASDQQRQADFEAVQSEVTAPQRSLTFIVEVGGLVTDHSDDPPQAALDAAYTSLAGTRFVLSDDQDHNFDPLSVAASPHLMTRQSFYDAISPGADHLSANAAFGSPDPSSRQLVLRRKPYSDYAQFYIVTFNAFNPDGSARINRDVHTVTLRIITPDEPKYAVFEVDKMP